MRSGRAVLVVGHANWGKSSTLRALANGTQQRYIQIGSVDFFVRRMSNDDRPDEFYELVENLEPSERSNVILAFCPAFDDPRAQECLETLRRKDYRLFFWVLRQQYGGTRRVTPAEVAILRQYGNVEVFERQAEDNRRARALRGFVEDTVLR